MKKFRITPADCNFSKIRKNCKLLLRNIFVLFFPASVMLGVFGMLAPLNAQNPTIQSAAFYVGSGDQQGKGIAITITNT